MTDASGNKPDSVSRSGDLKAEVGAQLNCGMKVKGQPFNVNVSVTSVDGDQAKFDMVETVDKDEVASQISDQLTKQVGHQPDKVTCPDNLKGTQGATLRCDLTDQGPELRRHGHRHGRPGWRRPLRLQGRRTTQVGGCTPVATQSRLADRG